ncbi:hypothetical protein U3516DRAFT_735969 [Neocallimastix sp. 'constans']
MSILKIKNKKQFFIFTIIYYITINNNLPTTTINFQSTTVCIIRIYNHPILLVLALKTMTYQHHLYSPNQSPTSPYQQ